MEKHEKHAVEIFRRYMMQIHLLEIGRPSGVSHPEVTDAGLRRSVLRCFFRALPR